jgi:hypothetical protein
MICGVIKDCRADLYPTPGFGAPARCMAMSLRWSLEVPGGREGEEGGEGGAFFGSAGLQPAGIGRMVPGALPRAEGLRPVGAVDRAEMRREMEPRHLGCYGRGGVKFAGRFGRCPAVSSGQFETGVQDWGAAVCVPLKTRGQAHVSSF